MDPIAPQDAGLQDDIITINMPLVKFWQRWYNKNMADFLKAASRKLSPEAPKYPQSPDVKKWVEKARELVLPKEKEPPLPQEGARELPKTALTPAQAAHVVTLNERTAPVADKSERLAAIEKTLSQGLEQIYFGLDQAAQAAVKRAGEETARKIETLLESGKFAAKKILHLIRAWLAKIPGANKFFLEQESKIKTDRIMAMARIA